MKPKPTGRIECTDCNAQLLGQGGQGSAYSYPDGWRCRKDRDRHEKIIATAKRMMDKEFAARMVE